MTLLDARCIALGDDSPVVAPTVAEINATAQAVMEFVEPLIEAERKRLFATDFAESVRFRNKSMREIRALLGLDGSDEPIPPDGPG